jgi:hypothetical protein
MSAFYLVPTGLRKAYLKLTNKLGVSRQSITQSNGFYKNLVDNDYNVAKILNIPVSFNGTSATQPMADKRINYIKRHAHEPKTEVRDGITLFTRSALADIAWAAYPINKPKPDINKILNNTLKYYQVGCGCGCNGQNMKYYAL